MNADQKGFQTKIVDSFVLIRVSTRLIFIPITLTSVFELGYKPRARRCLTRTPRALQSGTVSIVSTVSSTNEA